MIKLGTREGSLGLGFGVHGVYALKVSMWNGVTWDVLGTPLDYGCTHWGNIRAILG